MPTIGQSNPTVEPELHVPFASYEDGVVDLVVARHVPADRIRVILDGNAVVDYIDTCLLTRLDVEGIRKVKGLSVVIHVRDLSPLAVSRHSTRHYCSRHSHRPDNWAMFK